MWLERERPPRPRAGSAGGRGRQQSRAFVKARDWRERQVLRWNGVGGAWPLELLLLSRTLREGAVGAMRCKMAPGQAGLR